jgi:hypothetical protein
MLSYPLINMHEKILKPKNFLVASLVFLLARNLPLCISLPIWIFGDEMAHLDYALKLQKGHVPQPLDFIEPELFAFDRDHRDTRFVTEKVTSPPKNVSELGFGGYSYAARHPPLPHLIFILVKGILSPFRFSLLVQVKILRVISLLTVAVGIYFLYRGIRGVGCLNPVFYSPLLLIALLAQDTYFSINTDAFSFCFFSFSFAQMINLISKPISKKHWMLLALGTILALWTKITNILLFPLWFLLLLHFIRENKRKKIIALFLGSLFVAVLLSSPWYIYNLIRFGNPFTFRYGIIPGEPAFRAFVLNWSNLKTFVLAFTRTLFRGEMLWHGHYLDILPLGLRNIAISIIPLLIFLIAAFPVFNPSQKEIKLVMFIRRGAVVTMLILIGGYFLLGKIPYYHARYSLGTLYLLMFMITWGWRKALRSDVAACIVPALLMMIYNVVFTGTLLNNIMGLPPR